VPINIIIIIIIIRRKRPGWGKEPRRKEGDLQAGPKEAGERGPLSCAQPKEVREWA